MTAGLSEQRLAEIRRSMPPHPAPGTWALTLRKPPAEVDRLRATREVFLADYESEEPKLFATLDTAKEWCATQRRTDEPLVPWDWFEQDGVHAQWRTNPDTDRPLSVLLGSAAPGDLL
jgi:hypothetical protein